MICYLFAASRAVGKDDESSWQQYVSWLRSCWQGRVGELLTEMDAWQSRLGEAPPGEGTTAEEKKDLAGENPERVAAYLEHLKRWAGAQKHLVRQAAEP